MKLRRIFAAIAACAIAATSVISASAANGTVKTDYDLKDDGKGNYSIQVLGSDKFEKIDYSKIASMDITLSWTWAETGETWIGGTIMMDFDGLAGWEKLGNWGSDPSQDIPSVKSGTAFNVSLKTPIPADTKNFNIVFQNYCEDKNGSLDYKVEKIVFKDKDGKELTAAAAGDTGSSSTASTTGSSSTANNSTSNPKTGATAGLALAGLALAGAAVVAAKKSK